MHHAILVAGGAEIVPDDLNLSRRAPESGPAPSPHEASLDHVFGRLFDAGGPGLFDHVVDALIRAALAHCDGNQVQAARLLGISRNVLRSQLARMGLIPGRRRGPPASSA